jgi:hypothetical protein
MSKSKGIAEGVVFDVLHVPPEYVPLAGFHQSSKRHHNALMHACEDNKIRRIRYRRSARDTHGLIYVHKDDAAEIVLQSDINFAERQSTDSSCESSRGCESSQDSALSCQSDSQIQAAVTALCEINNGIAVLCDTLRDLVAAVQLLGEQQEKHNEPAGSWRDRNGEVMN